MKTETPAEKAAGWLKTLCTASPDRAVGSEGNRMATAFLEKELGSMGWETRSSRFDALDWNSKGVRLLGDGIEFTAYASPYSLPFHGEAELVCIGSAELLEKAPIGGKLILLYGEIAREQLMPKNFVFYNPEEHQRIISFLEKGRPAAIICATGRNAALAGGVYPFPLIEDGDFDIPSVYMTEEEGAGLRSLEGRTLSLRSISERIPSYGYNISTARGRGKKRIVVTAHIDSKKGSPGAIDNATGVVVLLLLAEKLRDYKGDMCVELVAFNGEDYYAVPGQMKYIEENYGKFGDIILNINIDGAGYFMGPTALSLFSLPHEIETEAKRIIDKYPGLEEGIQWPQGDHSIFLQSGVPAIAVSSSWFINNMDNQDITHTPKDNIEITDCSKLDEIAAALYELINKIH